MATILKASEWPNTGAVVLRLDDLAEQAGRRLEQIKAEAAEIVAEARKQAETIRRQAAEEGARSAMLEVERMVAEQTASARQALQQAAAELASAKPSWLAHWESTAVRLASAIAAKVIRRQLSRQPEITTTLVREALDLAAGSPHVRIHLHPEDYESLGSQIQALAAAMSGAGIAEITADTSVSRGGCRLETRFGVIDQQIESQLRRIEEELIG